MLMAQGGKFGALGIKPIKIITVDAIYLLTTVPWHYALRSVKNNCRLELFTAAILKEVF